MNIWFWLILMFLVLVIIFLILKIIIINNSLKDMIKQLRKKMLNTNNIIMTKTNNKKIKQLINDINKELQTLHDKEMQYQNGNQELYKSVTNISHDLRTPLTVIKGYTSLLEKESNTKKVREYLKIISDKVCEMENLTELLFDYSRIIDIVDLIKLEKNCLKRYIIILEEIIFGGVQQVHCYLMKPINFLMM